MDTQTPTKTSNLNAWSFGLGMAAAALLLAPPSTMPLLIILGLAAVITGSVSISKYGRTWQALVGIIIGGIATAMMLSVALSASAQLLN